MSAVGRLGSLLSMAVLAVGLGFAHAVPASDQEVATASRLAAEARRAATNGDFRTAAGQMLRAVRWAPSRVLDLRQAVKWLARFDPAAAVRQSRRLLVGDPTFGRDDDQLLRHLKGAAVELETAEGLSVAARLARRCAVLANQQERANAWREAGELHGAAGEFAQSSEAFARLQQLVVQRSDRTVWRSVRWDLVAGIHLDAGEPGRAAVAIGLLAEERGETREVLVGRARIGLRLGEPLAALSHAKQAIELPDDDDPAWDASRPYGLLVESLRAINQSERAVRLLEGYRTDRPDETALSLALIRALQASGETARALEVSRSLIERLSRVVEQRDEQTLREELVTAATVFVASAKRAERYNDIFDWLPKLAGRFGLIDGGLRVLGPNLDDPALRRRLAAWCDGVAKRLPRGEPASGTRRAAVAVGVLTERHASAAACLRSRLESAVGSNAEVAEVIDELEVWAAYAIGAGAYELVASELEGALAMIALADSGEGPIVSRQLGRLLIDQAECLVETQVRVAASKAPNDRVVDLLSQAERLMPDDASRAAKQSYLLRRVGRLDDAIAVGRRFLSEWPRPDQEAGVEEAAHRTVVVTFADALSARALPGDDRDAVRWFESALVRWPGNAVLLNAYAYHQACAGRAFAWVERMARRAVAMDRNPDYLDTLGWVLFQRGRPAEAAELIGEAIALAESGRATSDLAALRAHHAAALRQLGRAEEAEAAVPK